MLGAQDELMCHQLPTTFDHVQQSDLRWTERVVIYGFDPATGTSVMTGMARYPNRNLTDAYAMVTVGGQAHVVRTSREISAGVDGIASWQIGPYSYRIIEPLRQVHTTLEHDGLSLDLMFTGTFPCYEQEPAFFRHRGRVDEDARRFYQNGFGAGSLIAGGQRIEIDSDRWYFGRDHSWGVRRGGGGGNLPETAVLQPHEIPDGVLYFMGIFQFDDRIVHFAQREDADGHIWHYEGELLYPLSTGKPSQQITSVDHGFVFRDSSGALGALRAHPRVIASGEVTIRADDGSQDTISITPVTDFWPGFAGYDEYRGYASGHWRGPSYTDAFVVDTSDLSEVAKVGMLSETLCTVRCGDAVGQGLVEMVFIGRNDRYGYDGY
jgi:hypothetical protein